MKILIKDKVYTVEWKHFNNIGRESLNNKLSNVLNNVKVIETNTQNYTECIVKDMETKEVFLTTKATLNNKETHFNKEMGRKVSLKKVIDKLSLNKISRKNVWHNYFIYTNQMNVLDKMNKNK
jgi:hypothetical protein